MDSPPSKRKKSGGLAAFLILNISTTETPRMFSGEGKSIRGTFAAAPAHLGFVEAIPLSRSAGEGPGEGGLPPARRVRGRLSAEV
jgi:hypothetical protein